MATVVDKVVRGPALKQVIQDQIKKIILDRDLHPGDLLPPEWQLAQDLGVSRGSVREAIKSLESLGILGAHHGDGVRVREFNFDSVLKFLSYGLVFQPSKSVEILQIREWLEVSAVAQVVALISDSDLVVMEELLRSWECKALEGVSTADEDRNFHRMLYAPLGNDSLLNLIDVFWVVYNALPSTAIGKDLDPKGTVQAHRGLLAAVRQRRPILAQQQMREHFHNIERRFDGAAQSSIVQATPAVSIAPTTTNHARTS